MIGRVNPQTQLFGTRPLSDSVPENHVLRKIRAVADEALAPMVRAYESSYAQRGDYGIPPEVLIRAKLLQALYSIKSEQGALRADQLERGVSLVRGLGLGRGRVRPLDDFVESGAAFR